MRSPHVRPVGYHGSFIHEYFSSWWRQRFVRLETYPRECIPIIYLRQMTTTHFLSRPKTLPNLLLTWSVHDPLKMGHYPKNNGVMTNHFILGNGDSTKVRVPPSGTETKSARAQRIQSQEAPGLVPQRGFPFRLQGTTSKWINTDWLLSTAGAWRKCPKYPAKVEKNSTTRSSNSNQQPSDTGFPSNSCLPLRSLSTNKPPNKYPRVPCPHQKKPYLDDDNSER